MNKPRVLARICKKPQKVSFEAFYFDINIDAMRSFYLHLYFQTKSALQSSRIPQFERHLLEILFQGLEFSLTHIAESLVTAAQ